MLDRIRAKQIMEATEKINVVYQGSPVWIEGISDNNIAEVRSLQGSQARIEVPVNLLEEKAQ